RCGGGWPLGLGPWAAGVRPGARWDRRRHCADVRPDVRSGATARYPGGPVVGGRDFRGVWLGRPRVLDAGTPRPRGDPADDAHRGTLEARPGRETLRALLRPLAP